MKKYILSAAMLVMGLAANAQTDLVFADVAVASGAEVATATVSISTLDTDASGLQCDVLPAQGVSIINTDDVYPDTQGLLAVQIKKASAWNFEYAVQKSGATRFLVYGTKLATFVTNYTSTDKSLFTIPFSVKGLADGAYEVKVSGIEVSNGAGKKIQSATEASFKITVGSSTGISAVENALDSNEPAYNVAGQKVAKNYKGIVVKSGKKFMNK